MPLTSPLPLSLFDGLQRTGPAPLYLQVAERIEGAIADGTVPVESWLENEATLSQRLGVSRSTTRQALDRLVRRGLLVRRRGLGTRVIRERVVEAPGLVSLFDEMLAHGRRPSSTVLTCERVKAPNPLVDGAAGAIRLCRLRCADGEPVALLTNWVPRDRWARLSVADLERHGLFELLRASGEMLTTARQVIGARPASADERALLSLPTGSFVMTLRRTVADIEGRIVVAGDHVVRPDDRAFAMTLSA